MAVVRNLFRGHMVAARAGRTRASRGGPEVVSTADGHRRTRSDHAGETAADYVELIDDLIKSLGEARAVDLARHLGVTQVTVTNTIERLKREGLVTSKPYRSVFLTPKGKRLAAFTRRGFTHHLVHGMKGYNGVAILSRVPFECAGVLDWCGRQDCRHVHAKFPGGIELHSLYGCPCISTR